jgi:hypothetical protein
MGDAANARGNAAKRQRVILPYQCGQNEQKKQSGAAYGKDGRLVRPPREVAQLRRPSPTLASSLHLDVLARAAQEKHGIGISILHPLLNMIEDANNIATRPAKRKAWLTRFIRSVYDALAEELAAAIGADEDDANSQGVEDEKGEGGIVPKRRFNQFSLGVAHWSDMQEWRQVEAVLPRSLSVGGNGGRAIHDAEQADSQTELGDFVYELLCHKYGLKHLVDQKIWDLLITLHQYQQDSPELKLFAEYLAKKRPPSELAFMLHCRRKLQARSEGEFVPGADGPADSDECVDVVRAQAFVSELFGSLWVDRIVLVVQRADSLQGEQRLPPSYQSTVQSASRRAERTQSLLDHCLVQVTAACSTDPGVIGGAAVGRASGVKVQWISVLQLVDVLHKEAAHQAERFSAQKWAEEQFTEVDSNGDQYISFGQFDLIFQGVTFPRAVDLRRLFAQSVRDEQAMTQMSRPQFDVVFQGLMDQHRC